MSIKNLQEFIARLEARNQLRRIPGEVSAELEITEITDRISKGEAEKNKALLFENVSGSTFPVLINAFGNAERMAMALGVEKLDELTKNLGSLLDMKLPQGMGAALNRGMELMGVLKSIGLSPSYVRSAPAQEVTYLDETVNLDILPVLKCWPLDAGRFITLPTVITRDPVTHARNVGMYRLQVRDRRTLSMHWQLHKGGAEHTRQALESEVERIPVAVSLGGDPAAIWSGSAPLPPGIDEFLLAGWLRGKPVEMAHCLTQPLEVPAEAEIVIEGYVDPHESAMEGPFGDHTGYYTPEDLYPVMHVTALTHRRQAVYPATVVGVPPMEDFWMGKATERLFLPLMQLFLSEIIDVNMPAEGVFHNLVLVRIHKRYPGQARKVISGLWGMGLMMLAKAIIVLDEDVDVQNVSQALFHAFSDVDWSRDIIVQNGPVDALDHSSYQFAFGGKIGIDATRKKPEEGYARRWPQPVSMSREVKERIDHLWETLGL